MLSFERPSLALTTAFMDRLESMRASLDSKAWKHWVRTSTTCRKWRYFLACDPYTRWGLLKPRGYAGDATLMDFAYRHPSVEEEINRCSPDGSAIYQLTSAAEQSKSARARLQLVANKLNDFSETHDRVSVASFASGHGRELEFLAKQQDRTAWEKIVAFTAIDSDADALQVLAEGIPVNYQGRVRTLNKNILRCRNNDIEPVDFCYSLGLFDYLDKGMAEKALARMWQVLKPGGVLIVANLAQDAANLGYCEAIMDWWMVCRSEEEMQALGCFLEDQGDVAHVGIARAGCFYYLTACKA